MGKCWKQKVAWAELGFTTMADGESIREVRWLLYLVCGHATSRRAKGVRLVCPPFGNERGDRDATLTVRRPPREARCNVCRMLAMKAEAEAHRAGS